MNIETGLVTKQEPVDDKALPAMSARKSSLARETRGIASPTNPTSHFVLNQKSKLDDILADLPDETSHNTEALTLDGLAQELRATRRERDSALHELNTIYASDYWYWLDRYWQFRGRLSQSMSYLEHLLYVFVRRVLPLALRQKIALLRQRLFPQFQALAPREVAALLNVSAPASLYDVICFPVIDWDFRQQRPQQLMRQYAAAGHRVFYLSQKFRLRGRPYQIKQIAENIYEVSLRGPALNVYTTRPAAKVSAELVSALNILRRDFSIGAAISCVQLPFWGAVAAQARSYFGWPIVYDCMDYHAGFSTSTTPAELAEQELLTAADQVVVTSHYLKGTVEQARPVAAVIQNACDYEHFAQVQYGDLPHSQRPIIGYYGAIADWFDVALVTQLAEQNPQWDFLLIGDTAGADVHSLQALGNVHLTGEQPYEALPDWIEHFSVAFIPFRRLPLTEATNPVKVYELLAAGKPIVSVPLPEVVALGDLVRTANTAVEFTEQIRLALAEQGTGELTRRRTFAKQHTWRQRFDEFDRVARLTFPKASVIIVTYNNLDLNRLCLKSVFEQTEWPNFEVIVVDNASSDGTAEFLLAATEQYPNLRVILNAENFGFAKANNQGLQVAQGEYLILLNNDTVVCRGWLTNLVRHLAADAQLGLLGPVTNEIGNEAKISVGYKKLSEMPRWARDYVRRHDDDLFEIPMLAMFCLAMRRTVYEQIGPLDEQFGIGMFEDDDYTRRARDLGYKVLCANDVFVHHAGRASFKLLDETAYNQLFTENRRRYETKWNIRWEPHKGVRPR